jgi:hypothetical protein
MERLPSVSKDVRDVVCRQLERDGHAYVVEMLKSLNRENPRVAEFLTQYCMKSPDPLAMCTPALAVYRLLQAQLEVDALNRNFTVDATAGNRTA